MLNWEQSIIAKNICHYCIFNANCPSCGFQVLIKLSYKFTGYRFDIKLSLFVRSLV